MQWRWIKDGSSFLLKYIHIHHCWELKNLQWILAKEHLQHPHLTRHYCVSHRRMTYLIIKIAADMRVECYPVNVVNESKFLAVSMLPYSCSLTVWLRILNLARLLFLHVVCLACIFAHSNCTICFGRHFHR